jgi:transposase
MQISTIGIDLAKNVFQVHGVDAAEKLVLKKQLRRSQVLEFFSKLSHAKRKARRRTRSSGSPSPSAASA